MIIWHKWYQLPASEQNVPHDSSNKTDTSQNTAKRRRATWWKDRHGFKAWFCPAGQVTLGSFNIPMCKLGLNICTITITSASAPPWGSLPLIHSRKSEVLSQVSPDFSLSLWVLSSPVLLGATLNFGVLQYWSPGSVLPPSSISPTPRSATFCTEDFARKSWGN